MTAPVTVEDWQRAAWEVARRADASFMLTFCRRCFRCRNRWPAGEPCCTRRGAYRGRHRKVARR